MKLKLSVRMSQRLVMTPAMQQAIKLLPLTRLELVETIRHELDENPFLDELTPEEEAQEKASESEAAPETQTSTVEEGFEEESQIKKEEKKPSEEADWDSYMQEEAYEGGTGEGYNDRPSLENTLRNAESLHDHLMWQLNVTVLDPKKNEIGQVLIGDIDDDGFFKTDLAQIAEEVEAPVEEVEEVLKIIKKFDPTGVGAKDIKECLLLQSEALEPDDPIIRELILDHLDHLAERNYAKIAKDLGVDVERIIEGIEFIRTLDPSPGSAFGSETPQYVVPDIYIVKVDDEWQVLLNDDGMPKLRINNFYKKILKSQGKTDTETTGKVDGKEKEFVENKFQSALWLIKSIEQRRQTLLKVGRSLVKFQEGFLDHGISHLRPLVLKDVAEDIEMHESTVSRVTRNKYLDTQQGIFELKFFFHSGVSSYLGNTVSSVRVKEMIKKIVVEEDEKKPATDDMVVSLLQSRDVKIARRTVTKYRKELGIPPASKRKKIY
jgi:RNA polymerase sigma-54 factor